MIKRLLKEKIAKAANLGVIKNDILKELFVYDLQNHNLNSSESLINSENEGLTVSLTTFGRRINKAYLAIESIGRQTVKPGRVVLWLSEDEFKYGELPSSLKRLENRGLMIKFCTDHQSYNKLIPSIIGYPDDRVITIDDDIIYNCDLIEVLFSNSIDDSESIFCGEARWIEFDKKNKPKSYKHWKKNDFRTYEKSLYTFPLGVGGVIYPPNIFHEDVINPDLFKAFAPMADDVWFKTMSLINRVKCKNVNDQFSSNQIPIDKQQYEALSHINYDSNFNDKQIEDTFKHYEVYFDNTSVQKL